MASVTRTHPVTHAIDVEMVGHPLQIFTVDYINAVDGANGPEDTQALVAQAINQTASILVMGPLGNSNTEQTFVTEGADNVVVGTLQTAIRALGTTSGTTDVDVSTATVTAKTFTVAV
jgi:heptaprenylglyceryl phosphate synthase|tara:strand:- start:1604 stop:1957 length:354 start_codon:yes stop_codon:yes gene_type:complete